MLRGLPGYMQLPCPSKPSNLKPSKPATVACVQGQRGKRKWALRGVQVSLRVGQHKSRSHVEVSCCAGAARQAEAGAARCVRGVGRAGQRRARRLLHDRHPGPFWYCKCHGSVCSCCILLYEQIALSPSSQPCQVRLLPGSPNCSCCLPRVPVLHCTTQTRVRPVLRFRNGSTPFALIAGAGKTTLLDVLSGRRTGRSVAGVICLNGHRATPAQACCPTSNKAHTGFCCTPVLPCSLVTDLPF